MTTDALIAAVFAMAAFGFTGSLHCAAMCGALAGSACSGVPRFASDMAQYHAARIGAYAVLGFAAGLAGAMVLGSWLAHAAQVLGVACGVLMLLYASRELIRAVRPGYLAGQVPSTSGPRPWWRWLSIARDGVLALPIPRPVALGLTTALLPCGFLLAALMQAALLSHPLFSALGMAAFAVASSPALLASAGVLGFVRRRAPRLGPVLAALLLLAAAVVVLLRSLSPPHDHAHMHHSSDTIGSPDQ